MGSACCVPVRDRAVLNRSTRENLQSNIRYSPSCNFQWDNRGRVAGEETSVNWSSDGVSGDDRLEYQSRTTVAIVNASEEGSPIDSFRSLVWAKSPVSDGNRGNLTLPLSDPLVVRSSTEVNESTEFTEVPYPPPAKMSPSAPNSSLSTSPLSSQSQLLPASIAPSLCRHSSGHKLGSHVPNSRIRGLKSPTFSISEDSSSFVLPGWSNESTRGSHDGSSDGWFIPPFPDLLENPCMDRWSFDSESMVYNHDRITSPSFDLQTCCICTKLLTETSVVAVLICGHVFHAECLETMTSEINKYDPACPICTFGVKQTLKMSEKAEKALKSQMNLKARKRFRNRVVDSDLSGNLSVYDCHKSSGHEEMCPKMSSSSSMKSSSGRPFLRRYFSFGSKGTRSYSENLSTRKRGFFWSRSSKE